MAKEKKEKEEFNTIELALQSLAKRFEGEIVNYGNTKLGDIDVIPTGSLSLDFATGIGGLPRGRIIELYGSESSGKSTLSLNVIANAQKMGGGCMLIDTEQSFHKDYAKTIGVDVEKLIVVQPTFGENALTIMETMINTGKIMCIVVDSVPGLAPRSVIEGEFGQANMGSQARLVSQAMIKLAGPIHKANVLVIFINQTRQNLSGYGSPIQTPGGNSLKFYDSMKIQLSKTLLKNGDGEVYGQTVEAYIMKNKLSDPFKKAQFTLTYGIGIDKEKEILDMAIEKGIVAKNGSWFSYGEVRLGQGEKNSCMLLRESEELKNEILEKVKKCQTTA